MAQTVPEAKERRVGDVMTTEIIKVQLDTRVSEIARLMSQHGVSGLPVVDAADRVVGIVTELDMMVRNTHFELPQFIFIFDAMIPLETPRHYRERLENVLGTTAREIIRTGDHHQMLPSKSGRADRRMNDSVVEDSH
jgi:CBS-domain-containing membrane protein